MTNELEIRPKLGEMIEIFEVSSERQKKYALKKALGGLEHLMVEGIAASLVITFTGIDTMRLIIFAEEG